MFEKIQVEYIEIDQIYDYLFKNSQDLQNETNLIDINNL